MAVAVKQDALYITANRKWKWIKLEVQDMIGLDHKQQRAWYIFPQLVVPIMKNNKVIKEALIVTEMSGMPVDPKGKFDLTAPETMAALSGLASLRNTSAHHSGREEPNWIFLAIVILCVAIGVVLIVAMISAFM